MKSLMEIWTSASTIIESRVHLISSSVRHFSYHDILISLSFQLQRPNNSTSIGQSSRPSHFINYEIIIGHRDLQSVCSNVCIKWTTDQFTVWSNPSYMKKNWQSLYLWDCEVKFTAICRKCGFNFCLKLEYYSKNNICLSNRFKISSTITGT